MRYKYQTGFGTLIQFIVVVILSLIDTFVGIISTCHSNSSDCVSNAIPTLIIFILTALWFAFLAMLGFFVQHKRDRKLTLLLMMTEGITLLVAGYFNLPRASGINNKLTSLADAVLSIWIIFMTINIFLYKKKRIVRGSKPRIRKRR